MPRSKKIEGRVPWPLVDIVQEQIDEGHLPYSGPSQLLTAFYLWQSVYGVRHPFTSGYFSLSQEEQDKINDFLAEQHEAGYMRNGRLVKKLAKEAGITGEESFIEHGEMLFAALRKLAK